MKMLAMRRMCLPGTLLLAMLLLSCGGRIGLQSTHEAEVMMTAGDGVRLLYEGPQDAKAIFCKDEIISIFRADRKDPSGYVEVAKVRVVGAIDKQSLQGVVVDGKVRKGDVARKALAACRVVPLLPGRQ